MQILYQIDVRSSDDLSQLRDWLVADSENVELTRAAWALAEAAWTAHVQADAAVVELAPDWPTSRQPPVDRAILRLGYHEMVSGHAPPSVAIDEAVELARAFCAEESPPFINGILDGIRKKLDVEGKLPAPASRADADPWLDDAVDDSGER